MNWLQFELTLHEIGRLRALLKVMNASRHYRSLFVDTPRRDVFVDAKLMLRILGKIEEAARSMQNLLKDGMELEGM